MSRRVLAALLSGLLLTGCSAGQDEPGASEPAVEQGVGEGDAAVAAARNVLRDGIETAPGTRPLGGGARATATGWYAALDLADAAPREVAGFYRRHLAGAGFALVPGASELTVVGRRAPGRGTTEVRVDVVPRFGEVPGFARIVART